MIIYPMLYYTLTEKCTSETTLAITIRVWGITITGTYITLAATAEEEEKAFLAIHKVSPGRAIVFRDVDARKNMGQEVKPTRKRTGKIGKTEQLENHGTQVTHLCDR